MSCTTQTKKKKRKHVCKVLPLCHVCYLMGGIYQHKVYTNI